jgi:hypothetical protein
MSKPEKDENPLLLVQVTTIEQKFVFAKEIPASPVFERPTAHGWTSVVFPNIHDQNTILETWLDEVHKWLRDRDIKAVFWCYAHGVEKKQMNRLSPVFFFKDSLEAASMMWRFKGEFA